MSKASHYKYLLTCALLCLTVLNCFSATPTASSIIARSVETLKSAQSIEAHFTATANGMKSNGVIVIAGKNFKLSTPEMSVWFNGRTQWAYSPSTGEVNISEPTFAELSQINPFAVMQRIQKGYKSRRLTAPSGFEKVELLPSDKMQPFSKVILTLNAKTALPQQIDITDSDGTKILISISSIKKGGAKPSDVFTFNPRLFPGVEVIDLR